MTAPFPTAQTGPPFFSVSVTKLIVMTICTLGIYELQWFYQHWWAVRRITGEKISPIWRTHFLIFFCYPLFRRVRVAADAHDIGPKFNPGIVAVIYVSLLLLAGFANDFWPVLFVSHLPLVVVQRTANEINGTVAPHADRNDRFSCANKVAVVIGGLIVLLATLTLFSSG
jgi:hypothetical protein